MNNKFYTMRHGFSIPNNLDIIVSNIDSGINKNNGLTIEGKNQVLNSINLFKSQSKLDNKNLIILSSPFSRAIETAEIIAFELGVSLLDIKIEQNLKERFYGNFDLKSSLYYQKTWSNDTKYGRLSTMENVESVEVVGQRMLKVINDLDNKFKNKSIILVSHGDPICILESYFWNYNITIEGKKPTIRNAEIRSLN
jgi:glucosyl-3-phosphoglycerate phosphatase